MKVKSLLIKGIIVFCFLPLSVLGQPGHVGDFSNNLPSHPRILMFKGDEAAIKKTIASDQTWTKLQKAILGESDNLISVAPIERVQIGRRLLDKSREALRRLFFLSYAYRMTGDNKYLLKRFRKNYSIKHICRRISLSECLIFFFKPVEIDQ